MKGSLTFFDLGKIGFDIQNSIWVHENEESASVREAARRASDLYSGIKSRVLLLTANPTAARTKTRIGIFHAAMRCKQSALSLVFSTSECASLATWEQ
jgi:hypothetical protein